MKLWTLVKYLHIPEEFNSRIDSHYFAHLIFPQSVPYDNEMLTLSIFAKVCSGEYYSFPKKFFQNENGVQRAIICMSYVLCHHMQFSSVKEIYSHFSSSAGVRSLKAYHLISAIELFETPIDLVHESLAKSQKNEFYYVYYKFIYLYKKTKTQEE